MERTIKMERQEKSADVHPDEVANYKRGGWVEVMPVKRKKSTPAPGVSAPKSTTRLSPE